MFGVFPLVAGAARLPEPGTANGDEIDPVGLICSMDTKTRGINRLLHRFRANQME